MHGRAAVFLAILAAAGCRRGPTGPDANYTKASTIYQQLYASQLDDAYGDPKMDEVVALLKKVDSGSEDAEPAQAMLGSIQRGRETLTKQRADREKLSQAAQAQAETPVTHIDVDRIVAESTPDAGPPPDAFGSGALVSEINASSGGCLTDYEPFNETGSGMSGTVYRLSPGEACAAKLPGYVGQAVLVVNGRIYRRIADPNPPKPVQLQASPDAGQSAQAAPDAGQAAARPAPKPAPAPAASGGADGGEPEYRIVYPGQPEMGTPPPAEKPPEQ